MNKSLLDTDIFSEITKGIDPTVAGHASAYRAVFPRFTISAVTRMESIRGFQRKRASRQLQQFMASTMGVEVIPFDEAAADLAGRIGGELERTGRFIGLADTMIAAIALSRGLELVTGNTAHFGRVQQLGYPLILVNWRL